MATSESPIGPTPKAPTPKAPMSLDAKNTIATTVAIVLSFGIVGGITSLVANAVRHVIPVMIVVLVAGLVGMFFAAGWTMKRLTANLAGSYDRARAAARAPAEQRGWTYEPTGPAPSKEVVEAVFRMGSMPQVADRTTEVITGTSNGYPFRAAHLEGHEVGYGSNTSAGADRTENIIELTLPGLLPEMRFRDRLASKKGDYGMSMPSIPTGDAAVDARWDIQSNYLEFVRDLLSADMLGFLASVPPLHCTMVIRVGELISCRDTEGSFDSITARLDILTGLANHIPVTTWNRATEEQAGVGYYPLKMARPNLVVWNTERVSDDADNSGEPVAPTT